MKLNGDSGLQRMSWSFLFVLPVRSHACEPDQFGKPGGCSDICLLGNSHKTRTCRCRSGFSLGSDGKSCKSERNLNFEPGEGKGARWYWRRSWLYLCCLELVLPHNGFPERAGSIKIMTVDTHYMKGAWWDRLTHAKYLLMSREHVKGTKRKRK